MVGRLRFELRTSALSERRSHQAELTASARGSGVKLPHQDSNLDYQGQNLAGSPITPRGNDTRTRRVRINDGAVQYCVARRPGRI